MKNLPEFTENIKVSHPNRIKFLPSQLEVDVKELVRLIENGICGTMVYCEHLRTALILPINQEALNIAIELYTARGWNISQNKDILELSIQ
jgi:hypothetical protein